MGFLDRLLGRSEPVRPDLDQLFALPSAALTLQTGLGMRPTGLGSVAFQAAEGNAFVQVEQEVRALLDADDGPKVERSEDSYGYTWLLVRQPPPDPAAAEVAADADVSALVTDLHAVNSTLQDRGFGPFLLCSLLSFADAAGRRLALVYLYKRGTFYPFAPTGPQRRDNALELQVRGLLAEDLRVEPELTRWFPVWGAPGL